VTAVRHYFAIMGGLALLFVLLNGMRGGHGVAVDGVGPVPVRSLTTRYDGYFRKFTRTYFGRTSWRWFKAQAIQESRLVPQARSRVGAMGLMQIMPATFQEIRREIGLPNTPWDPRTNIKAGIYYNLKCYEAWDERRSENDKILLMFASYNAGTGNIVRAQKVVRDRMICSGRTWNCIRQGLPAVTGRHSEETIRYVDRIQLYRDSL